MPKDSSMPSQYLVLQVPYCEEESAFLISVIQSAVKAHRNFHEKSAVATGPQHDLASETDRHQATGPRAEIGERSP
jgi:hypothetical protein